ncbi:TlpA disulfide reductase family protein [Celeribacter sp.]|uniref:TlpA disulfide reductase family protein n=1 Tax=Celeribacter sp. TaxID=1890673 RepID=UPI003A925573
MLKNLVAATLYTALGLCAIPASAADKATLDALRTGDMKKLAVHSTPEAVSDEGFTTFDGAPLALADYRGDVVLLNFWATWCAPCRHEMPALDALAEHFEGRGVHVLPVATGHNPKPAIERFFEEAEIAHLETALDPKSTLARDMAVLGLPVTVIIDRDGNEVARLQGDADWASDAAIAILETVAAE